jgi:hypothetical protein
MPCTYQPRQLNPREALIGRRALTGLCPDHRDAKPVHAVVRSRPLRGIPGVGGGYTAGPLSVSPRRPCGQTEDCGARLGVARSPGAPSPDQERTASRPGDQGREEGEQGPENEPGGAPCEGSDLAGRRHALPEAGTGGNPGWAFISNEIDGREDDSQTGGDRQDPVGHRTAPSGEAGRDNPDIKSPWSHRHADDEPVRATERERAELGRSGELSRRRAPGPLPPAEIHGVCDQRRLIASRLTGTRDFTR